MSDRMQELLEKYPGWKPSGVGDYYLDTDQYDGEEVSRPLLRGLGLEPDNEGDLFKGITLIKQRLKETIGIVVTFDDFSLADARSKRVFAEENKQWRKFWECADCEFKTYDKADIDTDNPFYECQNCGERFSREDSADGMSHKCPQCSRFGSKVAEGACPECQSGEMVIGREEVPA